MSTDKPKGRRSGSVEPPSKRSLIPHFRRRSGSMDSSAPRKSMLPTIRGSLAPPQTSKNAQRAPRPTLGFTTPSRSTMKPPSARYTMSSVRSSGGLSARPVGDPCYPVAACERIEGFLGTLYLSYVLPKEFRTCPSKPVFYEVFLTLARLIDPEFAPEGTRINEEEVLKFMRSCGFVANVPKSSLVVLQKRTWPNVLAMLDFLVDLLSVMDRVTERCEAVVHPITGDKDMDAQLNRGMMIYNQIMLPDYVDFTTSQIPEDVENERSRRRVRHALEIYHNIENVDLLELEEQSCAVERELEKQRSLANAMNAEYQELIAKRAEEHAAQGGLADETAKAMANCEIVSERIAALELAIADLESQLCQLEADNEKLLKLVANQPLSHAAATQLRSERRALLSRQKTVEKDMASVKQLIEEKMAELAPLRERFDVLSRTFHEEVIRHFGSKGLSQFGASSTVISDESVAEWMRTVGSKLNAAAAAKSAEMEAGTAALARMTAEVAELERRRDEMKSHLSSLCENHERLERTRSADEEKLRKSLEEAAQVKEDVARNLEKLNKSLEETNQRLEADEKRLKKLEKVSGDGSMCLAAVEDEVGRAKVALKDMYDDAMQQLNEVIAEELDSFESMFLDRVELHKEDIGNMAAQFRDDWNALFTAFDDSRKKLESFIKDVQSK